MSRITRAARVPRPRGRSGGIVALVVATALVAVGGSALAAMPRSHKAGSDNRLAQAHTRGVAHHRRADRRSAARHSGAAGSLAITSEPWGSVNGQPVRLFSLSNGTMTVKISNYGGVVQSIWVPNREGRMTDVALGFPNLSDYVNDFTQGATSTPWPLSGGSGDTYFGAIIGRYANRIANASFNLNNTTYKLDANNGTNTLHGGYLGWNTDVWSASTSSNSSGTSLALTANLPAGEGCLPSLSPGCTGFPAPVTVTVTYTLNRANELRIGYEIKNTSPNLATVVNVTNHTYFNLGGEGNHTVYGQLLALNSDKYTPVDTNLIPEAPYFVPVGGTPYDFRSIHKIGQMIRDTNLPDGTSGPYKQLQIAHGYDNNWVLNGQGSYRLAAVAQDAKNGVTLWAYTDQPGIQVYTGNFLVGDLIGTSGHTYRQGDAFTLETQHYPDSPHHIGQADWPSVVLDAGATMHTTTAFKFGVVDHSLAGRVHFG
jgi:aldose 1-epimerase